jgi:glycosyltransferase involved in cell wall biosynthesis
VRLAVYTDYVYRRVDGAIYAERAFALFLAALEPHLDRLRLIGRLAGDTGTLRFRLPGGVELAPMRHYHSLANPAAAIWSLVCSLRQMFGAVSEIDVVWILGPYPHAFLLALIARARRRTVVLGVRQDWPRYVRMRHPGRRPMHRAADLMEWGWRRLARRLPTVAVGSELGASYAHAPALLELVVSLVPESAVQPTAPERDYASELTILSVGRLDAEKNPLLLADALAMLLAGDPRWRLAVCGEGDLAPALEKRLAELGIADSAELLGYVPFGEELLGLYRSSHVLLQASWTEGFPQVLIEAFAAGLPVVATAVGGVPAGVGGAGLLVPPGDPRAAAEALITIATDAELRSRLIASGLERAHELTLERQTARLLAFLTDAGARR